jgi:hypothetical protein
MEPIHSAGVSASIDPDAHRRLAGQLQRLLDPKSGVEPREIVGVLYSIFRELETVHKRLDILPQEHGMSLHRWFWQPMHQVGASSPLRPQVYVFCLADTHAHVRDGQSLIALARHMSFRDAPVVKFEPIPVRAEKQQVPPALAGIFPTVAMLVGRPVLFGHVMRQYILQWTGPQRFAFTVEDPDAPEQGLTDLHFGDTFTQRRFIEEGAAVTEDYGLVRRFSAEDGPTSRTFYVLAGLSSLGTYAATLCSLFLLPHLDRDLPDPPGERSRLDVLVSATATHGEPFWNLDASSVRIVRAYLDDLVYQAGGSVAWQSVPPRQIEMVLRRSPKGGGLDIDHIVLHKLQPETIPGPQQQARIIGCLIHRSHGPNAPGTTGADLAEEKWIWRDRGRDRKIGASEAISKMLNVARRHLGSALVNRDNRYYVETINGIQIRHL